MVRFGHDDQAEHPIADEFELDVVLVADDDNVSGPHPVQQGAPLHGGDQHPAGQYGRLFGIADDTAVQGLQQDVELDRRLGQVR